MERPTQCRLSDVDSLCRGKRRRLDGPTCPAGRLEKEQTRFLLAMVEAAGAAHRLPVLALRSTFESRGIHSPQTGPKHCSLSALHQRWSRNKQAFASRALSPPSNADTHPPSSPCKRLKRALLFRLGDDRGSQQWIVPAKGSIESSDPMLACALPVFVSVYAPSRLLRMT
jgi:hypothetical protein